MRILICTKLFYPSEAIGSVRPTNFAIYLKKLGHDVTVITANTQVEYDVLDNGINIIRVSNSSIITQIKNKNERRVNGSNKLRKENTNNSLHTNNLSVGFFSILKTFLSSVFEFTVDFDWYLSAVKTSISKFNHNSFDIVLSSFGPLSSFLLGRKIKKLRIARFWISDFRDNMKNEANLTWLNLIYEYFEKKSVAQADLLTFVSFGQKEIFELNNKVDFLQREKSIVIYNGFERLFERVISQISSNKKMTFLYAGQLYSGKRDFSMFFEALSQLVFEDKVDIHKIKVCYAGNNSSIFQNQSKKFLNLHGVFEDYGLISKKDSVLLQNNADILIALTWNTVHEKGILTGKFFEYLQAQKPIISICCGTVPEAELTLLVRKLNLGIACETACFNQDIKVLKNYLLARYTEFLNSEKIYFEPDFEKVKEFHFSFSVKQLNNYMNILLNKSN
ncbi:MAG: hypothetical protein CUR34_00840 [Sediminibacterium sp.]|nr:MAG: hypothetical protein CUR34_00840 [Sediminibacterium sp.] [Sediminibacterium sp. FEMGT703S]